MSEPTYAAIRGLQLHYEIRGTGEPLVLLHGGLGSTAMMSDLGARLAARRRVIAVNLQAHGRTADINRPITYEAMGDDIAALIQHLGLPHADVMGYSLGGGAALRCAIQAPALVRKLVTVSAPFARAAWFPEVRAGMAQMSEATATMMKGSSLHAAYVAVAPDPDGFPRLVAKVGELIRRDYDWSAELAAVQIPVLLVFADADSMPPTHMAEMYGLLGGGRRDAGWDGSQRVASRLAILPGRTHYDVSTAPELAAMVDDFLG